MWAKSGPIDSVQIFRHRSGVHPRAEHDDAAHRVQDRAPLASFQIGLEGPPFGPIFRARSLRDELRQARTGSGSREPGGFEERRA